ncbi:vigilin [Protopterus annectens]|uniref:vigilin n=1 Tax=Protopterus annectens TaxID=7888 RepID=UPI001CFBE780|nr:vigilin [Protopterus annectens]
MSSVALLTQESFAEHRSGLLQQQVQAVTISSEDEVEDIPTYKEAFPPLPEKATVPEAGQELAGTWGKIRPIKSSLVTQVFHVPLEERKYKDLNQFGEGEQAKICLDIMQKTGAHLELSMAKDQGLSIMVSGKLEAVMKARKEIVARLQTQASATVTIPKEHHRFVIGKSGEKLQELELKTATKIQIPRPDDASNQIKITGTKEGIEKARHEILLISAEQDKRAVERVNVDKVFHPFIAGPFNKLATEMMQETGTRINIPPPSVNKTEIVITGEKEQVAQAVARIKKIYEEKKKKTTTIAVEVKKSQHKYVIGPKGNSLQEILERTGVSVEIPPPDSSSETVILRGEPEKLGQALTEVYAKANSFKVSSVFAPAWLHRFIIGKKGQNLAKITQQMPKVHIEFTEGEDCITLEGPTGEVEEAQAQMESMVNDLISRMDFAEITVDPKLHRHLIGKNGANINRIKEQYKVSVRIPPDNEKSNLIRIEGDPQGVQEAKKELLELASRMENERTKDMIIDHKFHRTIIGQKGEKIKEIRDKFPEVIINFPDPMQKSDIVQLRGPKNEVEKCHKFMTKMVADLIREETNTKIDLPAENSNSETIVITGKMANCETARNRILAIEKELANITEVEVSIPAKLHNSLIGSKGRFVRSLMEECGGVHIHFPTEGSGSDTVTIRGPAEDVEKAKKQLIQVAEEKQIKNYTVELRAKPEYHKFLIGKGGGNIRKVRDNTGARIIFPISEDKDQEVITIVGTEAAVKEAQKELEAVIKNLENVVEDALSVDPKHHRYFVARRGQVLREIAEEYGGVMVSFPRTGMQSDRVTLKGAKDCVEAAKKRMLEIIEDLDAQVTIECVISQRFHRSIMGPKGSRIQQITRDHSVQIKFPEREELPGESISTSRLSVLNRNDGLHNVDRNALKKKSTYNSPVVCLLLEKVMNLILGRCVGTEMLILLTISLKMKGGCLNFVMVDVMVNFMDQFSATVLCTLKALVPVTVEVEVPYDMHRYIIGQKGIGIRKMMDEYEVNIQVPAPELQSNVISITGLANNVERAKDGLHERVQELFAEQEDRALRNFKLTISVEPRHHPKIIGRKGAVITQIRTEHEVNIQFPDKNSENPDQIIITGYERNALAARDAIMKIVGELEEMISEDISLDQRVHARVIGARGKAIRKIMDEYKVDIRFPQNGAPDPNCVTVTGLPENVDEAIDHLLNLEEEYMSDVVENETLQSFMKPREQDEVRASAPSRGFVVRDAPWTATTAEKAPDMSSSEDFPSFGATVVQKVVSPWGPKRF